MYEHYKVKLFTAQLKEKKKLLCSQPLLIKYDEPMEWAMAGGSDTVPPSDRCQSSGSSANYHQNPQMATNTNWSPAANTESHLQYTQNGAPIVGYKESAHDSNCTSATSRHASGANPLCCMEDSLHSTGHHT